MTNFDIFIDLQNNDIFLQNMQDINDYIAKIRGRVETIHTELAEIDKLNKLAIKKGIISTPGVEDAKKCFYNISINTVEYVVTKQNYIELHFTKKESERTGISKSDLHISLERALSYLRIHGFVRIGRFMAVNSRICKMGLNKNGSIGKILFDNGESRKVSANYLKDVIEAYKETKGA